jgi:hypothetical protein
MLQTLCCLDTISLFQHTVTRSMVPLELADQPSAVTTGMLYLIMVLEVLALTTRYRHVGDEDHCHEVIIMLVQSDKRWSSRDSDCR